MSDVIYGQPVSREFERLRVRLWKKLLKRHSSLPPALFHYTDRAGLQGILTSGRLWATNARHLNDTSELEYACDLVDSVLQNRLKCASSRVVATFLDDAYYTYSAYEALYAVFVTSFCSAGNELSQWRAYAGDGEGYSIGF